MSPVGLVVALPDPAVAVHADTGRSREDQDPLVRLQPLKGFTGRSCHVVAVEIVDLVVTDLLSVHGMIKLLVVLRIGGQVQHKILKMGEGVQIQVLLAVLHFRDLLERVSKPVLRIENGRLVHVVPEALDPLVQQDLVLVSEPVPGLFVQHVSKEGASGPYGADERLSGLICAEISLLDSLVVDRVSLLLLDGRIDDRHKADMLVLHLLHEIREVGEALFVDREVFEALHVVDVQIDHIQRDPVFAVFSDHFPHIFGVYVTPAALPVAKSPQRCNVASADQPAEAPDDIRNSIFLDHIDVQIPVRGRDLQCRQFRVSYVKSQNARIIDKESELLSSVHHDKVVGGVQGPAVLQVLGLVAALALVDPAPLVDAAHIFSQSIDNVLGIHGICQRHFTFIHFHVRDRACLRLGDHRDGIGLEHVSKTVSFDHHNSFRGHASLPVCKGSMQVFCVCCFV